VSGTKAARDVRAEIAYLTRALKAPTLRESAGRLAERARSESWSHESPTSPRWTSWPARRM
jgi:hypothetical protein